MKMSTINYYFNSKIQEWKITSKKVNSKYIAAFDYIDKDLSDLSARGGGVSIISFESIIGVPVGITSAILTLVFSWTIGIIKKLLKTSRNTKTKHNKIVMLTESKLNSIKTLLFQALIDLESSQD